MLFRLKVKKQGVSDRYFVCNSFCIVEGNAKVAKTVIEGGASVNLTDNEGKAALHYAAQNGSMVIMVIRIKLMILINIFHIEHVI